MVVALTVSSSQWTVGAYEKTMCFKRAGESGEISVFLPGAPDLLLHAM
jgi:hypothetical protein